MLLGVTPRGTRFAEQEWAYVEEMIRQFLAKGVSREDVTQRDCQRIADKFDRWSRKRFGFRTPEEVYAA